MFEIEKRYLVSKEVFDRVKARVNVLETQATTSFFYLKDDKNIQVRIRDGKLNLTSKYSYNNLPKELTLIFEKDELAKILELMFSLGYDRGLFTQKERYKSQIGKFNIELDEYTVPDFFVIEIEFETESEVEIATLEKEIDTLASDLEIKEFEVKDMIQLKKDLMERSSFEFIDVVDIQTFIKRHELL